MNVVLCIRSALILYLLGSAAYMLFAAFSRPKVLVVARSFALFAFTLHCCVLGYHIWLAQRAPFSNMYETLLFFSWLLVVVTIFVENRYGMQILGAFTLPIVFLLLAATSLIASEIEPLLPSLRSNWLLVHVLTCFLAYTAFAVAFASSLFFLIFGAPRRKHAPDDGSHRRRLEQLDSLTYRMISFGFPFLTIGIVTGSVWADLCWGTYWSWDPKETWSLVTWLIYGAGLHLRHVSGMRGRLAAVASVVGFASVVCTYFGVNYLFSSLHAYA